MTPTHTDRPRGATRATRAQALAITTSKLKLKGNGAARLAVDVIDAVDVLPELVDRRRRAAVAPLAFRQHAKLDLISLADLP